jgi:hypothetical protein
MADKSSHSLLGSQGDSSKTRNARILKRSAYKTLCTILLLLALSVGCIIASITILLISHQDPIKSWKFQPSVLLSFLSGVYAAALSGLFTTGIAITWWRSIRHGSTLKQLHFISAGGNAVDIVPAFLAGSGARRVALVALVVLITNLTIGPLTQRATSLRSHDISKNIVMSMQLAQQIPDGWFGTRQGFLNRGLRVAQGTFLNSSLTTSTAAGYYCPANSTCSGAVPAAGINFECATTTEVVDLLDIDNQGSTVFSIDFTYYQGSEIFTLEETLLNTVNSYDRPMLSMATKYIDSVDGTCAGTLRTDICNITAAIVRYPILIRDNTFTLDLLQLVKQPDIISNDTSTTDQDPTNEEWGSLLSIVQVFSIAYRSKVVLANGTQGSVLWELTKEAYRSPIWPTMFMDASVDAESSNYSSTVREKCPMVWSSPTLPLISYMYDIMFRAAYAVPTTNTSDTAQSFLQTFPVLSKGSELWHVTDFRFLVASIAAMILGLLAAISLLWGWWQLDRYVSLSPLETGKALGAPIFAAAGDTHEVNGILKKVGQEKVTHSGVELIWSENAYALGTRVWGMKSSSEDVSMTLREVKEIPPPTFFRG